MIKAKLIFSPPDHAIGFKLLFQLKEYKSRFKFILKQTDRRRGGKMCLYEFFKAANCNVSFTLDIITINGEKM